MVREMCFWLIALSLINPALIRGQSCIQDVGGIDSWESVRQVEVDGNKLYLADDYFLRVFDLSQNPQAPVQQGWLEFAVANWIRDLATDGNLVFAANGPGGLGIVDVSNPAIPVVVGAATSPQLAEGVDVNGEYAYVGDRDGLSLRVISISDPSVPVEVGSVTTPDGPTAVVAADGHAFVTLGDSGVQAVDISSPTSPALKDTYDTADWTSDLEVVDKLAFVVGYTYPWVDTGLHIIDVSDPANLDEISLHPYKFASGVSVRAPYAYIADGPDGLRVVDVSTPSTPIEVDFIDTEDASEVALFGSYAYVADGGNGLRIVDLSCLVEVFENGFESGDTSAWSSTVQ